ncbi:Protein phosphatase 1 regulatory subunit 15A [Papilio xuthus]|uniref:Protein phosphatase 1 regulatory subunit 15A n=1 Tax=Papilio xuthus TaxID=66420 RepID=A0A194PSV8_PAPXU|nr:Protein phosphatase 1 regulatory subunit 15A [Papilio xuthus]
MKNTFGDSLYIDNLHLIPDPLKKNLADSFITGPVKTKTNMASTEEKVTPNEKKDAPTQADHRKDSYPSLSIVTNFLSGVISFVSGAIFQKRPDSADYYECYDQNFDEMAPSLQAWQQAKSEDQNKNGWAHKTTVSTNESTNTNHLSMNSNCGKNAAHCEEKLNQVCFLLTSQQPTQCQMGLSSKNPQVFGEQSPTEDCFEDAFTHEDFESLPHNSYFEYYGPFSHEQPEKLVSDAPRNKTEFLTECMEITKTLPDIQKEIETYKEIKSNNTSEKNSNIVLSCEDKMNKLKLFLQDRKKDKSNNSNIKSPDIKETNNIKEQSEPILIPNNTKYEITIGDTIKNATKSPSSHTLCSENIVKDIKEDLGALSDSQSSTTSEYLNPCNYFDEVTGRFYSTSAESDDSFQIVFTDSPNLGRGRIPSECESEDSFIVFDETPDSCYSSNDVFGDELNVTGYDFIDTSESETSDDSDSESDSGCDYKPTCKLSHTLSRTIGDLTDDSLYIDADEVDCAAIFVQETPIQNPNESIQSCDSTCDGTKPRGLLVDERRKLEKKKQPCKTVRFSPNPPKVHVMRVWAFAARQARAGHWERHALDRERFKRRIADVEMAVSWVLKPQHRARVMFQRFMPWWNAQKRKELAEKKEEETEESGVKDTSMDKNVEVNSEVIADTSNESKEDNKELDVTTIKANGPNILELNDANNESMSHKYLAKDEIALDIGKINGLNLDIHGNNIDLSI